MSSASEPRWGAEQIIQAGLIVLVALMPFHAFLSVWLGSLTHHEAIIQSWKEVLLLVLAALSAMLVLRQPARLLRLREPWVVLAVVFAGIALLVTAVTRPPLTAVAFGLKTDLEFLVAAVVALLVATPGFVRRLVTVILTCAGVAVGFGLLQIFVLPADFLTHFGYGSSTILPYEHIEKGVATLRFASTLGGPNQLGTYLILPIALSVAVALRRRQWWWFALTAGGLVVLWGTYSRGAWFGAVAAIVVTWAGTRRRKMSRPLAWGTAAAGLVMALGLGILALHSHLQYYLLHGNPTGGPSSDSQHAASLAAGLHDLAAAPLGHGLGTAGPATFHAGTTNILENFYLQTGYETGVVGMLAFAALVVALLDALRRRLQYEAALPVAAAVIGVSIVALVLPSWVDSTTALITWTTAGAVAGLRPKAHHV